MGKLKTSSKTIVDSFDLDRLVQETYNKPYCFQQQDGCKPRGTVHVQVPQEYPYDYENEKIPEVINGQEMGVSFEAWLKRDGDAPLDCTEAEAKASHYYWGKSADDLKTWQESKSHINMFFERNFYPSVEMILNDLHAKGLVDAGEYVIEIDW